MNVEELTSVISSSKPFNFIHYVKNLADRWDHFSLGNYSHVAEGDEFKVLSCLACPSHPDWNTYYLWTKLHRQLQITSDIFF